MMMYRPVLFAVLTLTMIHSYGSVQVQMPEASALQQPDDDLQSQIRDLQKNVSDLWSYIYELRQAVSQHLTHLREHQVSLEESVHKMEHYHDGDQSAAHTHGDDHHHHSGEHSHGSDQHSHSGEHSHSGDAHSHSGDAHSHSGDAHSHSGEQHSHSGEHHSHSGEHTHSHSYANVDRGYPSQDHDHHSHSHSHSYANVDRGYPSQDHSHSHSHEEGDHHDHKDSHETEDMQQQTQQVAQPVVEPVITATQRENHHHHHSSSSRSGSLSPINLMNEPRHHHHHHHDLTRNRNRTVVLPKYTESNLYDFAICNVEPNRAIPEEKQQNVQGRISLWQKKSGGPLNIYVSLRGFKIGDHAGHHGAHQAMQQEEDNETPPPTAGHKHGFHIHSAGDLSDGCQSTGPHYNPKGVNHAGPNALVRHVGDLGNIECDDHGITNIIFSDSIASLKGPFSIIGKSLVIHETTDDLGLGGDEESLKTGNAGTRIACCIIESVEKLHIRTYKALRSATQYQNR